MPGYGPRLVLLNGVPLDAPLPGTTILFMNNDQPGVIGQIGTILGKHGINIANFALGPQRNRRRRGRQCRRTRRREDRRERDEGNPRAEAGEERLAGSGV